MSKNTDNANDYALAKLLNEYEIKIFSLLADHGNLPDASDVNRSYVLLSEELKEIYARQPKLKKMGQPICWQVMSNLELFHENIGEYKTLAWEYVNSGADYGQEHNASVITLCIKSNASKPVVPPEIDQLLSEAEKNISAFQYELDKMNAKLSIKGFTIPVVTIGETIYRFSSMREGSLVLRILEHCLENHPDEQVDLNTLKKELNDLGIKVPAKTNIKEEFRTSRFGAEQPLNPFVTAFPKAIIVRPTVELSDKQVEMIELAIV